LVFKDLVFHGQLENRQSFAGNQARILELLNPGGFRLERMVLAYHFLVAVRRDHLIEDTLEVLSNANDASLLRKLYVVFRGEEGVDAGGVTREYFHLIVAQLFSPHFGMFRIVQGKYYWFGIGVPDEIVREILPNFALLGTLIALAVYNKVVLPIRFPLLLFKKLLGRSLSLRDYAEIEPEAAASLREMLAMPGRGEDVADLGLTWVANVESFGTPVEIPLIPDGATIDVTNNNVKGYVKAYVKWFTEVSVSAQFKGFARGFRRVFSGDLLERFAPDEFDTLISGEEVFDWDALARNAHYSDGYTSQSRAVKWFWQIFGEFPAEQKAKFLQFTTGSDRAPVGGLANVVIAIKRITNTNLLPISHTCFSILGLPDYQSKEEMKKKLLLALTETEGFGLR
jgi:ubiquitin-protein ligase E3 A